MIKEVPPATHAIKLWNFFEANRHRSTARRERLIGDAAINSQG